MNDSRWPTFLILGAPRAGTTFLFQALARHPAVFASPVKEPSYFHVPPGQRWPRPDMTTERYLALFDEASPGQERGEASTLYLYDPAAADRIWRDLPCAKLVAVLRNPVERAYSHFALHRMIGREPFPTFEQALAAEPERRRDGHSPALLYRDVGLYANQIRRYQARFPRERLLFIRHDEMVRDPSRVVGATLRFLGLDPARGSLPTGREDPVNPAKPYRYAALARFVESPAGRMIRSAIPSGMRGRIQTRLRAAERPPLESGVRRALADFFTADIHETERLLGWDLSDWVRTGKARAQ